MTDSKTAGKGIEVRIATTLDEIMTCFSIRSAAFIGRGEPFEEEFDGNDFISATHLIAYDGGRPVGTMRIRILSTVDEGVATWERLAILPQHRGPAKILLALANHAVAYCTFKQVHHLTGAVEDERLIKFWERMGFRRTAEKPLEYNGSTYTPMGGELSPPRAHVGVEATSGCECDIFAVWLNTKPSPLQRAA